jgi:hypothetical protein
MLDYLEQLCESRIPRKFTCAHAVMALRRLQIEPYLGRYILQDMLGLSEASVRSVLNLLKRHELIQVNPRRKGHRLSRRGEEFVQWLSNWIIPVNEVQFHDLVPEGTVSIGVLVRNAGHLITSGVDQRDDAIRRGALGAVTLIVDNNTVRFPCDARDMSEYAANDLEKIKSAISTQLLDGDVIMIGWGNERPATEGGVLNAAIKLLFATLGK